MSWVIGAGLMIGGLLGMSFAGIGAGLILIIFGGLITFLTYASKEKDKELKRLRTQRKY